MNADQYKVRNGQVVDKKVATKKLAIDAAKEGGPKEHEIDPERQNRQALTDEQMLQPERTGRKIEAHFGCPQDIEWCWADDTLYMLQSRPITTLKSDPLTKDALMTIIAREDFIEPPADEKEPVPGKSNKVISPAGFRTQIENDHAIVANLVQRSQTSLAALKTAFQTKSGMYSIVSWRISGS